jgi:glycosyltransferase involved in cell wall biosynthesis
MKLFLVSNMYPSDKFPNFGIFVQNFEESYIENGGVISEKVVINSIYSNIFIKFACYIIYYFKIIFKGLFSNYDIIYVHYVSHNSLPIYILSKFRKKRLVLNFHGDDLIPRSSLTKIFHFFIKKILLKTDLVVLPSLYFKNIFSNKFEFNSDKIFVSPSAGINTDYFNQNDKIFDIENITIGFVSRLEKGKGWRNFIRLLHDLQYVEKLNVTGVIVGDGSEKKILEEELLNKVNKINLILYTKLNHFDLANVYKTFDLFIFPSELPESLGLVGIEAMASGVPCIGSAVGGITSYLNDGLNGYLFNPSDYNQLLIKTKEYLDLNNELKMQMRMNCIETASKFDRKLVGIFMHNRLMNL